MSYLIDDILLAMLFLMIIIMIFLQIDLLKSDPAQWLAILNMNSNMRFWNFAEKLQPTRNQGLLGRRENQEKDQPRE
ncbi:MAG: hypothetical protein JSV27_11375 [Candidatus Bathyarchaeota archaeon]|nr:MAG: hypothetical protein JSV27_11375 [Candidatus Bathyarchaeota archaeon]